MPSLSDRPELVGFFSYSREDDEDSRGNLSALRDSIQRELSSQLGRSKKSFRLWQDHASIAPGKLWESEIKAAIEESVFVIPIVTPRAINSKHCRFEFESFLAREASLGRNDLVFPILYISVDALDDEDRWRDNLVLGTIARRQYVDWRELRYLDPNTPVVRATVGRFCRTILEALNRPWSQDDSAAKQAIVAREKVEAQWRQEEEKSPLKIVADVQRRDNQVRAAPADKAGDRAGQQAIPRAEQPRDEPAGSPASAESGAAKTPTPAITPAIAESTVGAAPATDTFAPPLRRTGSRWLVSLGGALGALIIGAVAIWFGTEHHASGPQGPPQPQQAAPAPKPPQPSASIVAPAAPATHPSSPPASPTPQLTSSPSAAKGLSVQKSKLNDDKIAYYVRADISDFDVRVLAPSVSLSDGVQAAGADAAARGYPLSQYIGKFGALAVASGGYIDNGTQPTALGFVKSNKMVVSRPHNSWLTDGVFCSDAGRAVIQSVAATPGVDLPAYRDCLQAGPVLMSKGSPATQGGSDYQKLARSIQEQTFICIDGQGRVQLGVADKIDLATLIAFLGGPDMACVDALRLTGQETSGLRVGGQLLGHETYSLPNAIGLIQRAH